MAPSPCGDTQSWPEGKSVFSVHPGPSDELSTPFTWARQELQGTISLPMQNPRDWGHYMSNGMEKYCRCKAGIERSHLHMSQKAGDRNLPYGLDHKQVWLAMGGHNLGDEKLPSPSSSQSREGREARGWLPTSQVHSEPGSALQEEYLCPCPTLVLLQSQNCPFSVLEDQLARACRVSWWFRRCKMKGLQTHSSWACR